MGIQRLRYDGATVVSIATVAVLAGFPALSDAQPANDGVERIAFEAVSIRLNTSPGGVSIQSTPGRFTATRIAVTFLLIQAFDVRPDNVINLPNWAVSERFDIEATVGESERDRASDPSEAYARRRDMLRTMLVERFGLRIRQAPVDSQGYALRVEANRGPGPQLRGSSGDCEDDAAARPRPPGPRDVSASECFIRSPASGSIIGRGVTIGRLASALSASLGVVVLDETGMQGLHDFQLSWAPEPLADGVDVSAPSSLPTSVFTAVREQLGLRLEPRTVPEGSIVIERLERPTPN